MILTTVYLSIDGAVCGQGLGLRAVDVSVSQGKGEASDFVRTRLGPSLRVVQETPLPADENTTPSRSVGWLVDWSIVGRLVGRLVDRLVGCLVYWLSVWLNGWAFG